MMKTCFICVVAVVHQAGCKADPKVEHQRTIPTFICQGMGDAFTGADWDYSGPKGRVEIYKGDNKLCYRGAFKAPCWFDTPITSGPLKVKCRKPGGGGDNLCSDVDELKSIDLSVLGGPTNTDKYRARLDQSTTTVTVPTYDYEYVCCEANGIDKRCPNTQKVCTPTDGGEQCTCPNEGMIYAIHEGPPQEVQRPAPQFVYWNIDVTWFGPKVKVLSVEYVAGEHPLTISGPGLNPGVRLTRGGSHPITNGGSPVGFWMGVPDPGTAITHQDGTTEDGDEERVPTVDHFLRLRVACTGQLGEL